MARFLLALAMIAVVGVPPDAQTQTTTGEIFGKVTDSDGGGMPGVAVTVFGPALQSPLVLKTDGRGAFRADVPAGTFNVWFTLHVFKPVMRERVSITAGSRTEVNTTMPLAFGHDEIVPWPTDQPHYFESVLRVETSQGDIRIAVDSEHAPITATNFLKYVDAGFYTNGTFYRVTRPDNYTPAPPDRPMMEIIQGGSNKTRDAEKFPAIPLERTNVTGIKHVSGTVSMARGGVDTATTEFFILLDDQPSLDFGGKRFPDGQGGAAFGRVLSGMDVVRKIQQGSVQGQNLMTPVKILGITRQR